MIFFVHIIFEIEANHWENMGKLKEKRGNHFGSNDFVWLFLGWKIGFIEFKKQRLLLKYSVRMVFLRLSLPFHLISLNQLGLSFSWLLMNRSTDIWWFLFNSIWFIRILTSQPTASQTVWEKKHPNCMAKFFSLNGLLDSTQNRSRSVITHYNIKICLWVVFRSWKMYSTEFIFR